MYKTVLSKWLDIRFNYHIKRAKKLTLTSEQIDNHFKKAVQCHHKINKLRGLSYD